jgi:hypothetical protein
MEDVEIGFATTIKASLCGVKIEGNGTKEDVNSNFTGIRRIK